MSPAKSPMGCIIAMLVFVLFFGIFLMTGGKSDDAKTTETALPAAPPAPKTAEELRSEKIRSGFSLWDGSHVGLEKIVKQAMHNPDSYEHVKTTYVEKGENLIVTTEYRGTNGFGGVVTNRVIAKTDLEGNVLKIISEGK
jgi:hypothetical protein